MPDETMKVSQCRTQNTRICKVLETVETGKGILDKRFYDEEGF